MEKCIMKSTIVFCCLLIAATPLALAQDISNKRPKIDSPYKSKADAEKHKADMQLVAVCSNLVRQRNVKEGTPEWSNLMSGCLRDKKR
jgi:hypothetical protein